MMSDEIDGSYLQAQQQQEEQEWQAQGHHQLGQHQLNTKRDTHMNDINNMSFNDLVPTNSKYLKKDDVGEDGVILTIRGFKEETIEGDAGDEQKIVMYFLEDYHPMVVNRTNSQLIGIATGAANAGEARGKKIVVYNDTSISFGGKVTGGLRIKKIAGAPKEPMPAVKQNLENIEGDVPF